MRLSYEAVLNKKVVGEITAENFGAAKKQARKLYGPKAYVVTAGTTAEITSDSFKQRVAALKGAQK